MLIHCLQTKYIYYKWMTNHLKHPQSNFELTCSLTCTLVVLQMQCSTQISWNAVLAPPCEVIYCLVPMYINYRHATHGSQCPVSKFELLSSTCGLQMDCRCSSSSAAAQGSSTGSATSASCAPLQPRPSVVKTNTSSKAPAWHVGSCGGGFGVHTTCECIAFSSCIECSC